MVTFDSTDLDNAVSESGVVHESVANTDHDDSSKLKQGYSIDNPYLSSDLVGYWPLQEDSGSTAYDFSGNGNDGSITGATVNQTGLLGTSAYNFDGTDDHIQTGKDLADGISKLSFVAWIKPSNVTNRHIIVGKDDDTNGRSYSFAIRNKGVYSTLRFDNGTYTMLDAGTVHVDVWQQIILTFDGTNSESVVYLNGKPVLTKATDGTVIRDTTSTVYIGGRSYDGYENYFYGKIADVRIYSRVLTATEVQNLYDVVDTPGTLTTGYKSA